MALDFAAGCIGGAAGVLVGYPLDTVKVKIQTQDLSRGPQYKGTYDCLNQIVKSEGVKGLYKGISSPLGGVAAINAVTFGVYGNVLRRLKNPDSVASVTLAGASAGLLQTFIVSPMELVKTQMQVGGQTSISGTIKHILKSAGPQGLCRGLGITFTREVPAFAIYFSSYELMVRNMGDSTASVLMAGGMAGVFSWVFTYPQDVIKSRLQADTFGPNQMYKGPIHCAQASLRAEGTPFLTRGIVSTIIRAFPMNAATFFVYKAVMDSCQDLSMENVYETLKSTKAATSLGARSQSRLSTIVTDMPNIILIQEQHNLSQEKFFPEQMLFANMYCTNCLSGSQPSQETYYGYMLNMNQFNQVGTDVIPVIPTVIQSAEELSRLYHDLKDEDDLEDCQKSREGPHKPSLLATCKSVCTQWNSSITMSDFLLPSLLKHNSRPDRIYGFYYLVA